jgi:hypothetical protein
VKGISFSSIPWAGSRREGETSRGNTRRGRSPAQGGGRRTDDGGSAGGAESWVCLVGREMNEESHLGDHVLPFLRERYVS